MYNGKMMHRVISVFQSFGIKLHGAYLTLTNKLNIREKKSSKICYKFMKLIKIFFKI